MPTKKCKFNSNFQHLPRKYLQVYKEIIKCQVVGPSPSVSFPQPLPPHLEYFKYKLSLSKVNFFSSFIWLDFFQWIQVLLPYQYMPMSMPIAQPQNIFKISGLKLIFRVCYIYKQFIFFKIKKPKKICIIIKKYFFCFLFLKMKINIFSDNIF